MKQLGFAIIGLGSIADFHLQAIREVSGARLAAVSSRDEQRAREFAEREGCGWTADYRELLRRPDVDVVCVTTSSGSHYAIGLDVLLAGKHLVVEKPAAMTTEQAVRLIGAAEERSLLMSVISQRRFEPQHQAIRRALDEGKLGRLLLAEVTCPYYRSQEYYDSSPWRGTIAEDGGALMNQAIHSIDLLLWLVGSHVRSVSGMTATQTHRMEAEDLGMAMLAFDNGAFGRIMASTSIRPGFSPRLALYGERGSIVAEGTAIVHWSVPDDPEPASHEAAAGGGGVSDPRSISTAFHAMQLQDVADALRDGKKPAVTGEDGARAVALIEAIYRSAREGRSVEPVRV